MELIHYLIYSHYYSRLYYAPEVWFQLLTRALKNCLNPLHFYPLRLAIGYFKCKFSNREITSLVKRATPNELNSFRIARLSITIINSAQPFCLSHELMSHALNKRRRELKPWFLYMSRIRIGWQSFANRIGPITRSLDFDWLGIPFSKDHVQVLLMKLFFTAH